MADLDANGIGRHGTTYLLSDSQERWDGLDSESYYRLVTKASEPDSLSSVASIQLSFDPSYERLTLHAIRVVRGGQALDKLASARIDVLRREESLEQRLLDGRQTVSIELDDIRVGDVVDYSYTISGHNPALRGHYFSTFRLEFGVPVGVIRRRLTAPEGQYLNINYLNGTLEPETSSEAGESTYEWIVRDSPGFDLPSETPPWYLGGRAVQISSFRSWQEVIDFEIPLYAVPTTLSPQLQAEIDRIRREHPDPKERLREILARIQSGVRYLGIELGASGYAPRDPSVVFQQRFGDCKDMSLLMVTMARSMDIAAFPAIVDTSRRIARNGIGPTLGFFDHVVVLARIDGESYWLDPTRTLQFGTLDHLFQSDFGEAIVLEPGAVDLVQMKRRASESPTIEIEETFDLTGSFDESPADYRVTTRYRSYRADSIREQLRTDGIEKIQERFANYYKRAFPGLAVKETMEIADDVDANQVTTREHYAIADAWRWDAGSSRFEFSVSPYEIESNLTRPSVVDRSAPYERPHPVHAYQKTTVLLPFSAPLSSDEIHIEHAAFRFDKNTSYDDVANVTTMEYRYQSKADAVSADDLSSYLAELERAEGSAGYWVRTNHLSERGKADLTNYDTVLSFWISGCVILVPLLWYLYRRFRPVTVLPGTQYYPVNRIKLFAMSLLTLGCYANYWAYRNWLSIKRRGAPRVAPKLFGLLYPITYYWLLRDVNRAAGDQNRAPVRIPALWALALLLCNAASISGTPKFLVDRLAPVATLTFTVGMILVSVACLLPCVDLIGRVNDGMPEAIRRNSRFSVESWIAILIFLPLVFFVVDRQYPTRDINDVSPAVAAYLDELGLVDEGEVIESFRAPSDFYFRRAGSVITDHKVFRYWTSNELSDWYSEKAAYDDIVAITFERDRDRDETQARFVRRQGDTVNLVLPRAEGEVVEVMRRLIERSPSAAVSYVGMDEIGDGDDEKTEM